MSLSPNTQAVLLLTARFSKPGPEDVKPLGPKEWGRFALWLKDQGKSPDSLLSANIGDFLSGWSDKSITIDRVRKLLERGSALAIASEKWLRGGLWVLSRSDAEYPKILKQRLQTSSPPVLFGCGNMRLLNKAGIAVVGSRNASKADLDYAAKLGASAANAGLSIISGGARGIDEAALLGALQIEGTAVGILADNLMRASSSKKYRKYLLQNNLVLVSPYQPEAQFNVGNAMGRNKYIYCLADTAVVVHSGTKGGTWTGALENLKKGWVPLWVKPTRDDTAGNEKIVRRGAVWTFESSEKIDASALLDPAKNVAESARGSDHFAVLSAPAEVGPLETVSETSPSKYLEGNEQNQANAAATNNEDADQKIGFYDSFLVNVRSACAKEARSPNELQIQLNVDRGQLDTWLKKAVEDEHLRKLTRPVRYEWLGGSPQGSLFSG